MNLALLAALIGNDNALIFVNTDRALTNALPADMQQFMRANFKNMYKFLESEEGKVALQTFVSDWQSSLKDRSSK